MKSGFAEWLGLQLKAQNISLRQLGVRSGVDHSTISRVLRGKVEPSLATANKLARGLREIHNIGDTVVQNPTTRVEHALRADGRLPEAHVRQVMDYYLARRNDRVA